MIANMKKHYEDVVVQGETLASILYEGSETNNVDVVLVHGFTGSKEDFDEVGELLAHEGFRVLTFDNRGQHESSHSTRQDAYSMPSLGRDVVEITRYFGMKNPHLLGHSFGGLISQQAVVLEPSLWKTLTMFCSGPGGKSDWLEEPAFEILSNENKVMIWDQYLDSERKNGPRYEIQKKRWKASDAESTKIYRGHLRTQPSLISEIAKLGIPSHVVYGENDDAWPIEDQNQMARDLNAKISILPQCGHCPNEDNPTLTAKTLRDFWMANN